jgi:hypothetical protein
MGKRAITDTVKLNGVDLSIPQLGFGVRRALALTASC